MNAFDELYVISDLHLGGERNESGNFQIFNHGERLGNFIRYVAGQRPGENVALVLNGDVIDSLAEESVSGYVALNKDTALRMMKRIYEDESFKPVWDGLEHFITQPNRYLIVVVGNHDIELSLPYVEESIRQKLAGENSDAHARIHFATHGDGYACSVGKANVFCTHGNEVDDWNTVDYNKLGQLANANNAGRIVDPSKWEPNSGTRLVIDVMNKVKRRYPFVDLLKPETATVAAILLALDKDMMKQIDFSSMFPILRDKVKGGLVVSGLLGDASSDLSTVSNEAVANEVTRQLLGPSFHEAIYKAVSEKELLLEAERSVAAGDRPDLIAANEEDTPEVLGWGDLISGKIGLISQPEALRRALKDWIKGDRTLDVENDEDDLYLKMQDRVGENVDFVVTGHTHMALALKMKRSGFYYNCGTWIRFLSLSSRVLDDSESFEKVIWPAFKQGSMEALENARIPGADENSVPLFLDRASAVRISSSDNQVEGDLLFVTDGGANEVILTKATDTHKVA